MSKKPRRVCRPQAAKITLQPAPFRSVSAAMICSTHSINVSYRSRRSFPQRSPLPHFGVLKRGILGTRRSERSPSVPLSFRPKTVPNSSLFDNVQHRMAMEKAQDAVEEIRGRFGKSAITYACLMGDLKMPTDGRDKVKMPGLMYQ